MRKCGARPYCGRFVTGIALCRRRDVGCGLSLRINRGVSPAVACRAVTRSNRTIRTGMAHDGGFERRVVFVTCIALGRCRNVRRVLEYLRCATGDVAR